METARKDASSGKTNDHPIILNLRKKGRIIGKISLVRLGRGSRTKTAWKMQKIQPTNRLSGVQIRVHATKTVQSQSNEFRPPKMDAQWTWLIDGSHLSTNGTHRFHVQTRRKVFDRQQDLSFLFFAFSERNK